MEWNKETILILRELADRLEKGEVTAYSFGISQAEIPNPADPYVMYAQSGLFELSVTYRASPKKTDC